MNTLRILLVGVGVLGAGFAIWRVGVQDDARPAQSRAAEAVPVTEFRERTVGDAWTLSPSAQPVETLTSRDASRPPRIDSVSIREALRDVRIDESGNVVVDDRALGALRNGFAAIERLDADQLAQLQDIIRNGLPAPAGEQAATIVGNYYQYQLAAQTVEAGANNASLADSEAQLERTIALRHSYFGAETAEKLFGDEQAYARFTLASMKIASDASLSAEQKDQRQQQLAQMLPERLRAPNVDAAGADSTQAQPRAYPVDFPARYAEFERQKQAILAAGLVEEEKQAQLERLLHEHFAADEIDLALRYDPNRDDEKLR